MRSTCAQTRTRSASSVRGPPPNRFESAFETGDQPAGHSFRCERDPRRVPQEQRRHDAGDERQDQVGLAHVAALEPGRPLHLADDERRHDAGEDEHGRRRRRAARTSPGGPSHGIVWPAVDDRDQRHHDRREEHEEAPEDERVHQPGHEPLQQLALAERDHASLRTRAGTLARAVARLPHPHQPHEHAAPAARTALRRPPATPSRTSEGDRVYPPLAFRISAMIAGTTSCRSPITA